MHLHHGLLFLQLVQSALTGSYTEARAHLVVAVAPVAADRMPCIPHSARPPLKPHCSRLLCSRRTPPVWGAACVFQVQFTAKKTLCKERFGKFSFVFSSAKKLSKILCSFDIHFLFKYDLSEL